MRDVMAHGMTANMAHVLKSALACLATLVVVGCSEKPASERVQEAAEDVGKGLVSASAEVTKPVNDAMQDALKQMGDGFERRNEERKARTEADREARQPKAYRWKDKNGQWHVSDQVPPEGTEYEVIVLHRK